MLPILHFHPRLSGFALLDGRTSSLYEYLDLNLSILFLFDFLFSLALYII